MHLETILQAHKSDSTKKENAARSREWLAVTSRQIDAHMPSIPEAEASRQLFTRGI